MKIYKYTGCINLQNEDDLRNRIVKLLIFRQFYGLMKEFYIDYPPEQHTTNQEYLMMSNVLRDSHEYLENVNEAVWELLIETPDKLVEISTECAKLCKN